MTWQSERASSLYIVENREPLRCAWKMLRDRCLPYRLAFAVAQAVDTSLLLNWEAI
ncbi:Uncharacterized protein PPKH_1548 [Pseudomonas putida]|nr:Uncharacterized protein PPKH_1548 [Pseudomonas putida]